MLSCKFCDKSCKNNSLRNHERMCGSNPLKQQSWNTGKTGCENGHTKALKNGTKAKPPVFSEESRRKLSAAAIRSRLTRDFNLDIENGKKISKTVNEKVAKGEWHTSLAKHMHINYNDVDLHGSWELKYAQHLDANSIRWIRCKETFEYVYSNKKRRYTPDFYLLETDEYIEIKGYKRI